MLFRRLVRESLTEKKFSIEKYMFVDARDSKGRGL